MIQGTFIICFSSSNRPNCARNKKFKTQQLQSKVIEIAPLRLFMLLISIELTTEFKETVQIYMKSYRQGNKILPETTKYSTK